MDHRQLCLIFHVFFLGLSIEALPYLQKYPAIPSRRAWGEIRGGEGDDESHYTAVGVQVVATDDGIELKDGPLMSFLQSNYCILQDNGQSLAISPPPQDLTAFPHGSFWNGDVAALKSLATCCDIMVIVLVLDTSRRQQSAKKCLDTAFVEALSDGLQQRADNGMVSSVLVLLVSSSSTENQRLDPTMAEIKNQLVLRDLVSITPQMVSNLDLLSLDDPVECTNGLASTWKDILQHHTMANPKCTTSNLIDALKFPILLQATYQASGAVDETNKETYQPTDEVVVGSTVEIVDVATDLTEEKVEETSPTYNNIEDEENMVGSPEPAIEDPTSDSKRDVPVPAKEGPTTDQGDVEPTTTTADYEEILMDILTSAKKQIHELEMHLEEQWLGFSEGEEVSSSTTNSRQVSIQTDQIIDTFQTAVKEQVPSSEQVMQAKAQRGLWLYILPPLQKLYNQHLQFLREQCGKEYEAALEQSSFEEEDLDEEDYQAKWTQAASKITMKFREAAQMAIPSQCQPGGALRDADFDYVPALEGLLSDMMQATETQQELLGILPNDDEDDNAVEGGGRGGKRPAKWYEKIGARVLVFLVNYAQGWLAYQGIKRAAAQRDAHLPKFPLF
ncbi:expressed unknown protein [Seminavis robusta]|uniref:VWFA domain-containing protein n=1 Tax=Seminavis robusta TaxID=568900 RepID=A0A9N8DP99_9STRA|nr:expressed unknown protein [Seminavis robusta]|eukprot:Sro190_g081780.1 n/a (617) ;mRNA; r:29140-30990